MSPYWALFTARFRTLVQYRAAAVGGIVTQLFFGYVILLGYRAYYAAGATTPPLSMEAMTTYVWLGQAMLGLLPWWADPDLRKMMNDGTVAYELLRPVDLYWLAFSRAVAQRAAPTLLRAGPMFLIAWLFLGLQPPASISSGLAWAAATVGAIVLAAAIAAIMGLSLFWTISGGGIHSILPAMVMLFSGMLVPIPFFPEWAQRILNALPFRGIVDIPFRLYLGDFPPSALAQVALLQWVWIAALVILGRTMAARGRRRLVVQGG